MQIQPRTSLIHWLVVSVFIILLLWILQSVLTKHQEQPANIQETMGKVISGTFDQNSFKPESEWKKKLTSEQYHVLREGGTEAPFIGVLTHEKRSGTYYSVGCEKPLFRSEQKFDSGTGWPSFWAPIDDQALVLRRETAPGDDRIEVLDTCGNHLGHVFDDGPEPTGKRYCMNSVALRFVPDEE